MARQELPPFARTQSVVPAVIAFPLTAIGILREAIKTPARNGKFMLQVTLLILLPFSLIDLLHYLIAGPLIQRVEDSYENSTLDQRDVRVLMTTELVFIAFFCIVSIVEMMFTIYASASTYIGKCMGLNDLMLWIRSTWKKPLITWLLISSLTVIYITLVTIIIKLVNLIVHANGTFLWGWIVGIMATFVYLYLDSRWTLALVISVVEDDSDGIKALGRAQKLIRGRKLQGFLLMFILLLLTAPIYVLFYVTATGDDDELGSFTLFTFKFVATVLFCLAKFFTFVVFTVFYYECKQNHGEKVAMELGPGYSLVPCELQVDT